MVTRLTAPAAITSAFSQYAPLVALCQPAINAGDDINLCAWAFVGALQTVRTDPKVNGAGWLRMLLGHPLVFEPTDPHRNTASVWPAFLAAWGVPDTLPVISESPGYARAWRCTITSEFTFHDS